MQWARDLFASHPTTFIVVTVVLSSVVALQASETVNFFDIETYYAVQTAVSGGVKKCTRRDVKDRVDKAASAIRADREELAELREKVKELTVLRQAAHDEAQFAQQQMIFAQQQMTFAQNRLTESQKFVEDALERERTAISEAEKERLAKQQLVGELETQLAVQAAVIQEKEQALVTMKEHLSVLDDVSSHISLSSLHHPNFWKGYGQIRRRDFSKMTDFYAVCQQYYQFPELTCMVTDALFSEVSVHDYWHVVGAHIIPRAAEKDAMLHFNAGLFETAFDINSGQNGLLLRKDLEVAYDNFWITMEYNPLNPESGLRVAVLNSRVDFLVDEKLCQGNSAIPKADVERWDGSAVKYPPDFPPYFRGLECHFVVAVAHAVNSRFPFPDGQKERLVAVREIMRKVPSSRRGSSVGRSSDAGS